MALFLILVVVPLAELYTLIRVGSAIGAWNAIGLLVLVTLVGVWVAKQAGLGVLRRLRAGTRAGRPPSDELVDGFLILAAAVLLIFPGFLTDVVGVALLLPPVRALLRRRAGARLQRSTTLLRVRSTRVHDVRNQELDP